MRLVESIATFAVAADAAMGMPMDRGLRTAAVAARLGELAGAPAATVHDAFYLSLLRYVGCTADSDLAASVMGDEVTLRGALYGIDWGNPGEMLPGMARALGAGTSIRGAARFARTLSQMPRLLNTARSHCEVGDRLAQALGFSAEFRAALFQGFERWDGRGWPNKLKAEAIALSMRLSHVAEDIEIGQRRGGTEAAMTLVKKHAGKGLEPRLVECALSRADEVCSPLMASSAWRACLAAEPDQPRALDEAQLDEVLTALGDFSDLKSRFTRGHARSVAKLAKAAALELRLDQALTRNLARAALVHDVGRVAVSSAVWDKPGALNDAEWERVRMHTYVGERILSRAESLANIAEIAVLAHERLNGDGYHRRLQAAACTPAARLLAASDVYCALTETRPHRAAHTADAAAKELASLAQSGALCPQAVSAVLAVSGQPARTRIEPTAGLTDRELEVLRLVARGLTNKEVASALDIANKTVGRHLEHIYAKIGVTTRAAATLFALQHGLVS